MSNPRICVIIPFYQVQRGLLSRAVASVAEQRIAPQLDLIIVDDGSPISAKDEVHCPSIPVRSCRIIAQSNRGVGAARNTGLDAVDSNAELVAFLDSDDFWTDSHMARALAALEAGADLYFAKVRTLDSTEDDDVARWKNPALLNRPIPRLDDAFFVSREISLYGLRYGLPIQTLVFRRAMATELRFKTNVRRAGEDLQFTFALLSRASTVAYSQRTEALLGSGVNIYRSTVQHGADQAIPRLIDQVHCRLAIAADIAPDSPEAQVNNSMLQLFVSSLALQVLHAVRTGRLTRFLGACVSIVFVPSIWRSFMAETGKHTKAKLFPTKVQKS